MYSLYIHANVFHENKFECDDYEIHSGKTTLSQMEHRQKKKNEASATYSWVHMLVFRWYVRAGCRRQHDVHSYFLPRSSILLFISDFCSMYIHKNFFNTSCKFQLIFHEWLISNNISFYYVTNLICFSSSSTDIAIEM